VCLEYSGGHSRTYDDAGAESKGSVYEVATKKFKKPNSSSITTKWGRPQAPTKENGSMSANLSG